MPGTILQSDFTAGELSPSLSARVDLAKYLKGCKTLRNFFVQSHGGAVKRPGFELLDELPGPAALVPFVFNQEQAYCLCFGEGWMRVATHENFVLGEDGAPYQVQTPYTLEQARQLSYTQSADVLFIACHGVRPQKLKRLGHARWEFEGMSFAAPIAAPHWEDTTVTENWYEYPLAYPKGSAYYQYDTGTTDYYGNPVLAFALINEDLYRRTPKTKSSFVPKIEFVNAAKKSDGSLSKAQVTTPYTYYVTAVDKDGRESELSGKSEITGPASNNWQAGDYVILRWEAVPGAQEYRVYKSQFGARPGFVATCGDLTWQDYNIAPSLSEGAPKYLDPFEIEGEDGGIVCDYPGVVCLFEQRLVFASSPNRPQTIWMSKTGDYANFAVYDPIAADCPIEMTIASPEVSAASWLVALRTLIMGTSDMEWEMSGRGEAAFSAMNKKATPQSYWGSSLKRAMIIGNMILHVSSSGSQVRSLQYEFTADSYNGMDLSIMAAHLLEKERIIDWSYQKSPDSIIWAVRSDGALLGLTFQAEHQVSAWHRHDTQGRFRAVCSIPHGFEHSLFAVVERDGVFFLERMARRYQGGDLSGAVFSDCALTWRGEPARVIAGLGHLNGKTVSILADGAVQGRRTVVDGQIELDYPASVVTVGLPYTADLQPMPIEAAGAEGSSVTLKKQINAVNILFRDSLGVKVGLSFDSMHDVKWRTDEPYGTPPAPFSGIKQIITNKMADNILTVCLRSDLPTPVTVLALASRIAVNAR